MSTATPCFGRKRDSCCQRIRRIEPQRLFQVPHRGSISIVNLSCALLCAGVRYVVDAGRAKAKLLEAGGALARYEVGWVSKAAAEQRAGRAGRMGPGHCYRYWAVNANVSGFVSHA